jgi:hypothetical protein
MLAARSHSFGSQIGIWRRKGGRLQAGVLPADHRDFVYQQGGYRRERNPGGQRMALEEVESHARPAGACRDQSAADIESSDSRREVRAMDVPEPEELT